MPIFKSKDKEGNSSVNFSFIDGLPGYNAGDAINATINMITGELVIKARAFKRPEVHLPLNRILAAEHTSDVELKEKEKSVIARAAVGSLLLGPLGAVVGGMSGVGNKKEKIHKDFIFITYTNSNGEEKTIIFEIVGASIGWTKFLNALCPNTLKSETVYL